MSDDEALAVINAVLELNAALLGEDRETVATIRPDGSFRIGYRRGVQRKYANPIPPRDYPTAVSALNAAWVSLARARKQANCPPMPEDDPRVVSWPAPVPA